MPNKCVHCGKIYEDSAHELLKGCSCGSRFFFFFKEEDKNKIEEETEKLTVQEKSDIEKDVRDIVGDIDKDKPVVLDFESIKVKQPGKFEIDLISLFKRNPLVYKLEEGKYVIDIASSFQLKKGGESKKETKNKKR